MIIWGLRGTNTGGSTEKKSMVNSFSIAPYTEVY